MNADQIKQLIAIKEREISNLKARLYELEHVDDAFIYGLAALNIAIRKMNDGSEATTESQFGLDMQESFKSKIKICPVPKFENGTWIP